MLAIKNGKTYQKKTFSMVKVQNSSINNSIYAQIVFKNYRKERDFDPIGAKNRAISSLVAKGNSKPSAVEFLKGYSGF